MTSACPEFGFEITAQLAPHVDARTRHTLAATFHTLAESNGLIADGGGEREWHYVITRDGGQAIDADRQLLGDWIRSRAEITDVNIGPIVDLKEADV